MPRIEGIGWEEFQDNLFKSKRYDEVTREHLAKRGDFRTVRFSLCPNQVSLILATHLTWRYKGNKSESWDHFEGSYLRATVR